MYACKLQSESEIYMQKDKRFASNTLWEVRGNKILYWLPCSHQSSDTLKCAATEPENVNTVIYKVTPMKQKCVCLDNQNELTV